MKQLIKVLFLLFSVSFLYSQPDNFTSNYDKYNCFAFDDDNYYVGLVNGFVVQDRETGEYKYYSTLNSDMKGNNVSDIDVYKGKVYFTSNRGVYSYSNSIVESLGYDSLFFSGIQKDEEGYLWFYSNDLIFGFDGSYFKYFDLSLHTSRYAELNKIYTHEEYLWLSFKTYNNKYSYVLINVNEDTLKAFEPVEIGFEDNYTKLIAFSNGKAWLKSTSNEVFNYTFSSSEWSEENTKFITPYGYQIVPYIITNQKGKMWFIMFDKVGEGVRKVATFENDQYVVETKFEELAANNGKTWNRLYKFDDELILSTVSGEYYRIEDEILELIAEADTNAKLTQETNFYKNEDELFRLARVTRNETSAFEIIDIENNKIDEFRITNKTYFPYLTLGSYYKIDGMEFISRYYNNISRVNKDGIWNGVSTIGVVNDDGVVVKKDVKGDYYFYDDYLYKYKNGNAEKLFRFSPEYLRGIEIHNNNSYFYYSYKIGNHYVEFNLNRKFGVRVGAYDPKGEKINEISDEDDCINNWYEYGKYSTYYYGSVPSDIKIDNNSNIWLLTWTSLYYLEENSNCTYFKFESDEDDEAIKPNQIAYSRYQGKMYGKRDNLVYSFNESDFKTADSKDMVDGELNFIGECNDGLVYVATTDGRLFRLNTIDSWEKIPLVEGKESIHANIRNVFRSEDTLYVSTEIGLIKVHQKITSFAEGTTKVDDINVYPNPVGSELTVVGYEGKATIFNSYGTEIKNIEIDNSNIDVSGLVPGIYFISDIYGKQIAKFVKE
ncbi:MAG: T9SS type A sorting domain-containing protein [Chlorobiota bacterium]